MAQQHSLRQIYGGIQNNLGELYRHLGRFREALAAYQIALDVAHEQQVTTSLVLSVANMGLAWLALGHLEDAELCFREVLEMSQATPWDYVDNLVEVNNGLAEIARARGDFPTAWQYARTSEALARGGKLHFCLAKP
ncbi:MAG: tetratricopeptide repeat protein [Anaerolineae bacterium]|nr:tetratricopeptide repeat protein [Anaerolineae bacterium]